MVSVPSTAPSTTSPFTASVAVTTAVACGCRDEWTSSSSRRFFVRSNSRLLTELELRRA